MVDFLNNFSNSCSHRLYMFDRKIGKIEAELRLLEIKLNSLPGFEDERPKTEPKTTADTAVEVKPPTNEEVITHAPEAAEDVEEAVTEAPEPVVEEVDPVVKKYIKMLQFGVPVLAVKQKMQSEGVDPNLLKT
ncbi:Predicted coiled-coil domain-containing protein (DUF2360) [Nesidiocoris tenuis]|uniref:Predicted coiled-coil domain-containing protein (DUF2360) n=1 Tax=Nesidiocoris tenuis TaxID=355587 RepID=A0ABN7AR43_9HEMI|nr:Predicted coiled-coil domain-containing protein (DUF2360) [Nesidiocoris tenuis]